MAIGEWRGLPGIPAQAKCFLKNPTSLAAAGAMYWSRSYRSTWVAPSTRNSSASRNNWERRCRRRLPRPDGGCRRCKASKQAASLPAPVSRHRGGRFPGRRRRSRPERGRGHRSRPGRGRRASSRWTRSRPKRAAISPWVQPLPMVRRISRSRSVRATSHGSSPGSRLEGRASRGGSRWLRPAGRRAHTRRRRTWSAQGHGNAPPASVIRRVASMPFMPGIRTAIRERRRGAVRRSCAQPRCRSLPRRSPASREWSRATPGRGLPLQPRHLPAGPRPAPLGRPDGSEVGLPLALRLG
ncbi:hypothetical protein K376_06894 [Streptomyces sp. PsTaAH-130]|nr:hypothetical protein K376_06894 [Streptomyces sp. PsTaAH-130]